jgi:hypothetical protein
VRRAWNGSELSEGGGTQAPRRIGGIPFRTEAFFADFRRVTAPVWTPNASRKEAGCPGEERRRGTVPVPPPGLKTGIVDHFTVDDGD